MYKKISLILVEYPDGKIAVQPVQDGKELFENCEKCSIDAIRSRMTLVDLEYSEDDTVSVNAHAKILKKAFLNQKRQS